MKYLFALIVFLICFCLVQAGDHWKITSRGQRNVWAVTQTCPCGDSCPCPAGSCSTGQCTVQSQPLPVAPQAVESASSTCSNGSCSAGTCSSGSCGGSSRSIFRRR